MKHKIDSEFIRKWSPCYDPLEHDESEYKSIVETTRSQLNADRQISQELFVRMVRWKSARLLGRGHIEKVLSTEGYGWYDGAIKRALCAKEDEKICCLIMKGKGIRTAVASTILHFMYPDSFPIMDFRTVEVLLGLGCINSKSKEPENYPKFAAVLRSIAEKTPHSLRDVDRALFAYHKVCISHSKPRHAFGGNCDCEGISMEREIGARKHIG